MADPLERDKRKARRRYSWKKPWLFSTMESMRRTITEREVYYKIGILERHSTYKKPYWNFQTHQHGELYYSAPGFPPGDRPPGGGGGGGPFPPGGDPFDCEMACLGGMIDCFEGGCDVIACICGEPPYSVEILEDPTGGAEGKGGSVPMVCAPGQRTNESYGVITARVTDSTGQTSIVEFPLVDCKDCCGELTLTGAATVNPGAVWTGTLSPCCENVEAEASIDCGSVSTSVSPDGCKVYATPSAEACGTFTVTVTYDKEDCDVRTASAIVRVNNTGQGGAWDSIQSCTSAYACEPVCRASPTMNTNCIQEQYKYVYSMECCYTNLDAGSPCLSDCGGDPENCPQNDCGIPPCDTQTCGGNCPCIGTTPWYKAVATYEWKCSC